MATFCQNRPEFLDIVLRPARLWVLILTHGHLTLGKTPPLSGVGQSTATLRAKIDSQNQRGFGIGWGVQLDLALAVSDAGATNCPGS